jgi:prepilin-type N-terminal cleavage/methylation domain-containing protein
MDVGYNYMTVNKQSGFTLIEMIVSLALFSVVITITVGALLVLINTSSQLQEKQTVLTNLSFALDSMTREIRTGTNYFCWSRDNQNGAIPGAHPASNFFDDANSVDDLGTQTRDCFQGRWRNLGNGGPFRYHGLAFIEGGNSITNNSSRILYYYDRDQGAIFRRVGNGPSQAITSSGIFIKDFDITVTSSNSLLPFGDPRQPIVTIFVEAGETASSESFYIQTSVTQRTLDL